MNDKDPLHHPPKSANVGLGTDNESANAPMGRSATAVADRPPEATPRRVAGDPYETAPAGMAGTASSDGRGFTDLVKNLRDESMHLLRQEVNLAKTEMQEKANFFARQGRDFAIGLAVLSIGGLGLLAAASFLVGGLLDWLIPNLNASAANGLGFLIIGGLIAIIGYAMFSKSRSRMSEEPLTPDRTIQSLKEDKQWLTNKSTETTQAVKHQVTR